ncbi:MAG: hypothetical protein M0R06_00575 [Sphaerochaeta sp.]|jgi:hypothetical protein|nr:hypothetical protein [Sphaerochaeta sp.]
MRVKVLRPFTGIKAHKLGEIINVSDSVAPSWIEGGWVEPVENKLMSPPSENKAQDVAETGEKATEPSGAVKPVRRKIKHRKKAVAK